MITQSESGLSAGNYNSVRDAANSATQQAAFDITAYRYNMDFGNSANQSSSNTTDNDGTDWDVIAIGANQYRAFIKDIDQYQVGWTIYLEIYNGSTITTKTLPYSGGLGIALASYKIKLDTDGANVYAYVINPTGIYYYKYVVSTNTWESAVKIINIAGTATWWSQNALRDYTIVNVTASSTATGSSPLNALEMYGTTDWVCNTTGTGSITFSLKSLTSINVNKYVLVVHGINPVTFSFVLEGSNDNSSYTTINTQTNIQTVPIMMSNYVNVEVEVSLQTYKYYRVRFTSFKYTATNTSTNPRVPSFCLYENYAANSQVIDFATIANNRMHIVAVDSNYQYYKLMSYQNNAGTWSLKTNSSNELKSDYKLESISACSINGNDILVFGGYAAGRRIVKVDGAIATNQVTQAKGILYASYEPTSQIYGHITALDVINPTDESNYRISPNISSNNGKIFITCYSSDGSSSSISGYRCYTGYNIDAMSAGEYIPLPAGYGLSGVKLIQYGNYIYAWQKDLMYRSLSTDYFGSIPASNTDSTITSRISDYQFSMDQGFSGAFVLDNSDGYFDSHAWFNDNNTIQLIHKHGYNISGTDQLIQVAITEIDSLEHIEREGQRQIRVSFRDRIAWVTDKIKSEEPNDTRGPVFGFDTFDAAISSDYAGMGHLALQSGAWTTTTSMLHIKPVKNSNNIIFSTLLQEQDNFYASFTMNDANGTTTATYGSGLCFRAKDSKNFLYLTFVGSTAKLNKCVDGVFSEISTATVTTFTTTDPIIVIVEGAFVWIYHKGSSTSFSLSSAKFNYYLVQPTIQYGPWQYVSSYVSVPSNEFGRGFIGFISRQSTGTTEVTFGAFQATGLTMRPLSYGDAFAKIAALANTKGIMAYYDFLSGTWAGAASTRSGNQIQVTATGDAYRTDFTLPTNYVIQYKRTSGSNYGLKFLSATNSTYVEIGEFGITYYNGSATSTLASVAYKDASATSTDQTYYVGVQKTERTGKTMYTVCAWSNHLIGVYAFDSTYTIDFNRIAFKGIATYDVYMHEIPNVIDGFTVDPGEPMGGAIQRLLDGREFRLFTRYDGSIHLARQETQTSQFTYSYIEGYSKQFDKRALRTHVRVLGANVKAEYLDTDLLQKYGHLFEEQDSPYMMTEEECLNQAKHIIRVMKSTATQIKFQTSYNPTLEIGDHITLNDGVTNIGEYITTNISAAFTPQWECEITARLFVAEV